jgi:hypothetical protein
VDSAFGKIKDFYFLLIMLIFVVWLLIHLRVSGFSRIPNLFSCSFDSSRRYKYNTYNHFCTVFHKLSINLFLSSPIDRSRVHLLRITKFRTLFFSFLYETSKLDSAFMVSWAVFMSKLMSINYVTFDTFVSICIFSLADTKIISCGEDDPFSSIFLNFDLFLWWLTNMFKFSL